MRVIKWLKYCPRLKLTLDGAGRGGLGNIDRGSRTLRRDLVGESHFQPSPWQHPNLCPAKSGEEVYLYIFIYFSAFPLFYFPFGMPYPTG